MHCEPLITNVLRALESVQIIAEVFLGMCGSSSAPRGRCTALPREACQAADNHIMQLDANAVSWHMHIFAITNGTKAARMRGTD